MLAKPIPPPDKLGDMSESNRWEYATVPLLTHATKQILDQWEKNSPGRRQVMFKALTNIRPSHMLDPKLFDFAGLMRDPERERPDIPDLC